MQEQEGFTECPECGNQVGIANGKLRRHGDFWELIEGIVVPDSKCKGSGLTAKDGEPVEPAPQGGDSAQRGA